MPFTKGHDRRRLSTAARASSSAAPLNRSPFPAPSASAAQATCVCMAVRGCDLVSATLWLCRSTILCHPLVTTYNTVQPMWAQMEGPAAALLC